MGDTQTVQLELPALNDLGPELRSEYSEIGWVCGVRCGVWGWGERDRVRVRRGKREIEGEGEGERE